LWVSAELPASLATRVTAGQGLRLVDGGAELVVRMKEGAVDPVTQTVGVQAEFLKAVDLLPGQVVTLALPPQADGVVVPADAVVRTGNDMLVYVRRPDGVEARVVSLQPLGANYLATSGLAAGDAVVVRGASLLKGISLGLGGE
jgi:cobalt-zinc-cadmium efflux system membrane fusion protein